MTEKENPPSGSLVEGKDFNWNADGFMVFTREYLLNRGFCCASNCQNCPYEEVSCKKIK